MRSLSSSILRDIGQLLVVLRKSLFFFSLIVLLHGYMEVTGFNPPSMDELYGSISSTSSPSTQGVVVGFNPLDPPAEAIVYRPLMISTSRLAEAKQTKTFKVNSEIVCALKAKTHDWAYFMRYWKNTCYLYDKFVLKGSDNNNEDQQACYTRLGEEWIIDNQLVEVEMTVINCTRFITYNDWTPIAIEKADSKFYYYGPGVGCVYVHKENLTWDDARSNCQNYDADLFTTDDFQAFRDFAANQDIEVCHVGVRNNTWLNGREVTPSEWDSGEPYCPGCGVSCGMAMRDRNFYLNDVHCSYYSAWSSCRWQ